MKLSDFDYELPKELIAQEPKDDRSSSKLMVVKQEGIEHKNFKDIINYLEPGDVLVLNETKVEPCKLEGNKSTGGKAIFLFSKKINNTTYQCQITTSKPRPGTEFIFPEDLKGTILEPDGMNFIVPVRFTATESGVTCNFEIIHTGKITGNNIEGTLSGRTPCTANGRTIVLTSSGTFSATKTGSARAPSGPRFRDAGRLLFGN